MVPIAAVQAQFSVCPKNTAAAFAFVVAFPAAVSLSAAINCDPNYGCDAAAAAAADLAAAATAAASQSGAAVACGAMASAGLEASNLACEPVTYINASLSQQLILLPVPAPPPVRAPAHGAAPSNATSSTAVVPCSIHFGPWRPTQPPAAGVAPGLLLSLPAGFSSPAAGLAAYLLSTLCQPGSSGPAAGVMTGPLPFPTLAAAAGPGGTASRWELMGGRVNLTAAAAVVRNCAPCAPGSFAAGTGQTACAACAPGSFAATAGALACTACAPGGYQPSTNATACVRCALDVSETLRGGAVTATGCFKAEIVVERVWLIGQARDARANVDF